MRMRTRTSNLEAATVAEAWSHLTSEDLIDLALSRGLRVMERPLPDLLNGLYSDSLHMILLDSTLLEHQKRVALTHELVHAERHDASCANLFSPIEQTTCQEAACRLITPNQYAQAEKLYDGNTYEISCELTVTIKCVRDYQRWLRHHLIHTNYLNQTISA